MTEKCHEAGISDYLTYGIAYLGDKYLESRLKSEEERPLSERNLGVIILGNLCRIGFGLLKYEVNKDLCVPIA